MDSLLEIRLRATEHNLTTPLLRLPCELKTKIWGIVLGGNILTYGDSKKAFFVTTKFERRSRFPERDHRDPNDSDDDDSDDDDSDDDADILTLDSEDSSVVDPPNETEIQIIRSIPSHSFTVGKTVFEIDLEMIYSDIDYDEYDCSLLQTCQTIRDEATGVVLTTNTVDISSLSDLESFLAPDGGPTSLRDHEYKIHDLRQHIIAAPNTITRPRLLASLEKFSNLKILSLDITGGPGGSANNIAGFIVAHYGSIISFGNDSRALKSRSDDLCAQLMALIDMPARTTKLMLTTPKSSFITETYKDNLGQFVKDIERKIAAREAKRGESVAGTEAIQAHAKREGYSAKLMRLIMETSFPYLG